MTERRRTRTLPLPPQRTLRRSANGKRARKAGTLALCSAMLLSGCSLLGDSSEKAPITVMTWAPDHTKAANKPGMTAMAQAYARWVNAEGGIDGRKLEVLVCNDHDDPVGAAACARRAVSNNVTAVVGSYSQHGRSFLAPLESGGIPYIGGYGITEAEFTSPLSYPVNGGQPAAMAGIGKELSSRCDRVALVRPDTVTGDDLPVLFNSGLAGARIRAGDIAAPEDATEYTSSADRALDHATADPAARGCVTAALGERTDTFFDSFRRTEEAYPGVKTASVLGSVDQSLIDRTGGASGPYEGAYVAGWYPVASDPRWNGMREVINEHAFGDNRIDPADAGVQTTWIAFTVLRRAIEALGDGDVSAQAVRRTLDSGLKVDTGGLTPKLSWRFEDMIAVRDFPRLVNANVTFQVVRDGRLVSARRGFVNMSKTLERSTD
ncbi:ABC transporter substrate-binding protein [Streptomyces sp. NA04227]|uniref:ABC transporter substrate-binding protein n=1 Tax=Streptomyces sp. NA04227 TaxID=2742136 RepID=UPI00158FA23A|nr:ABC transporter substrate-binding protein [Streptomyces sp. NA04227]QKW07182.1 ABC transporter substrate-binding protein [Streptomyces sp. NA04227]